MNVIRKNILWLLLSQVATWVAALVTLVVVPNSLGSTDFGSLGFAVAFVGFFAIAGGLGTSIYLSRAIARDGTILASYAWNAVLLKLAVFMVMAPSAVVLGYALGNRGETLALIAIAAAGLLPYLLNDVFVGTLAGMQRMARPAMWGVAQIYFQTAVGILVLVLGGGPVPYLAVMTLGGLIPTIANGLAVRPFLRGKRIFDARIWRLLVIGGIPLLALSFLNMIYGSLDVPILHGLVGSEPVGWYSVAMRWASLPIFITTAVGTAHFPAFSLHGNPMTDEFAPLVNRALHLVLFVTIPASVGLIFTADEVVRLIYGPEYDQSIVLIRILAVGLPVIAVDTVLATALIASNRVRGYLGVAVIAACLNPIACVVLIRLTDHRYGNGAIGAAIATVGTELWIMAGALHFRSPGVVDRSEVGRIGRIVAAAAAMVPFLFISVNWPLALQVLTGGVVYTLASLAFGSITITELRHELKSMTRSRNKGRGDDGDDTQDDDDGQIEGERYAGLAPTAPFNDVFPQP